MKTLDAFSSVSVLVYNSRKVGLRFETDSGLFDVSRDAFEVFEPVDFNVLLVKDYMGELITFEEYKMGYRVPDITDDIETVKYLMRHLVRVVHLQDKFNSKSRLELKRVWRGSMVNQYMG